MSPGLSAESAVLRLVVGVICFRFVAPTTAGAVYHAGSELLVAVETVTLALPETEPLVADTVNEPAVAPAV